MARIRSIKPEFFKHEELFEAEQESMLPLRIAFAALWTVADREGRFRWRPRALKLDCLPYDDLDFSRVLDALASRGFVVKYEVDGEFYGVIPSFAKHQVINNREGQSDLPDPDKSNTSTREPRVSHASVTPLKQVQGEGKGREREGKGKEIGVGMRARASSAESKTAVVDAFRQAGSMKTPDTHRVEVWDAKGYRPEIYLAVVREGLAKNPEISSLSYFDKAIQRAHEMPEARAGPYARSSSAKPSPFSLAKQYHERDIEAASCDFDTTGTPSGRGGFGVGSDGAKYDPGGQREVFDLDLEGADDCAAGAAGSAK